MKIEAATPNEYVSKLPEERRRSFKKVRSLIRKSLPKGYKETIRYGMISYDVPPKKNGMPNVSVSFGNQKSYKALYFSHIYDGVSGEKKFRKEYEKSGKKLNMGKSCLRFKTDDDLNIKFLSDLFSGNLETPFK